MSSKKPWLIMPPNLSHIPTAMPCRNLTLNLPKMVSTPATLRPTKLSILSNTQLLRLSQLQTPWLHSQKNRRL